MEKCLSCFPVKCPVKEGEEHLVKKTSCEKVSFIGGRGGPHTPTNQQMQQRDVLHSTRKRATDLPTQRVASRCGALHVKVVAFVEAAALWPMRGIATRVFLVLGCAFIVGHIGTGDVNV